MFMLRGTASLLRLSAQLQSLSALGQLHEAYDLKSCLQGRRARSQGPFSGDARETVREDEPPTIDSGALLRHATKPTTDGVPGEMPIKSQRGKKPRARLSFLAF